jgi:hypothetical protein
LIEDVMALPLLMPGALIRGLLLIALGGNLHFPGQAYAGARPAPRVLGLSRPPVMVAGPQALPRGKELTAKYPGLGPARQDLRAADPTPVDAIPQGCDRLLELRQSHGPSNSICMPIGRGDGCSASASIAERTR